MVGMSKSGSRYGRRSNWFKINYLMQNNNNDDNTSNVDNQLASPNTNVLARDSATFKNLTLSNQYDCGKNDKEKSNSAFPYNNYNNTNRKSSDPARLEISSHSLQHDKRNKWLNLFPSEIKEDRLATAVTSKLCPANFQEWKRLLDFKNEHNLPITTNIPSKDICPGRLLSPNGSTTVDLTSQTYESYSQTDSYCLRRNLQFQNSHQNYQKNSMNSSERIGIIPFQNLLSTPAFIHHYLCYYPSLFSCYSQNYFKELLQGAKRKETPTVGGSEEEHSDSSDIDVGYKPPHKILRSETGYSSSISKMLGSSKYLPLPPNNKLDSELDLDIICKRNLNANTENAGTQNPKGNLDNLEPNDNGDITVVKTNYSKQDLPIDLSLK